MADGQEVSPDAQATELKQLALAFKRLQAQEDRLTDADLNEAVELYWYKADMEILRKRRSELDHAARDLEGRAKQEHDGRAVLEHLDGFCRQVAQGLDALTFDERQQLLRLLVARITVEDGIARVETVIPEVDKLRAAHGEPVEPSW